MSTAKPSRRNPGPPRGKERRAPPDAPGAALRKLKGALGRPMKIERDGVDLKVVLVERRRHRPGPAEPTTAQICEDLSARLLALGPEHAATVLRPLVQVHDALEARGWTGVAALPAPVLAKALAMAGMMAREERTPGLDRFIESLLPLHAAARSRDDRPERGLAVGETIEISESTLDEFDSAQRSWDSTTPSELPATPDPDKATEH